MLVNLKTDLQPRAFTDPVALHGFGLFRPVNGFQSVEQFFGIICNFKEPLG